MPSSTARGAGRDPIGAEAQIAAGGHRALGLAASQAGVVTGEDAEALSGVDRVGCAQHRRTRERGRRGRRRARGRGGRRARGRGRRGRRAGRVVDVLDEEVLGDVVVDEEEVLGSGVDVVESPPATALLTGPTTTRPATTSVAVMACHSRTGRDRPRLGRVWLLCCRLMVPVRPLRLTTSVRSQHQVARASRGTPAAHSPARTITACWPDVDHPVLERPTSNVCIDTEPLLGRTPRHGQPRFARSAQGPPP